MYLPTDLRQFVGEQMALGNYETFDDLVADALTAFRDKQQAELLEQIDLITTINGRHGPGVLASPYYSSEDVCERLLGLAEDDLEESFRHRSHALESFICLAVRENLRMAMSLRWGAISYVMFAEFVASKSWHDFRWRNRREGKLVLRMPLERQSWGELRRRFSDRPTSALPKVVRD